MTRSARLNLIAVFTALYAVGIAAWLSVVVFISYRGEGEVQARWWTWIAIVTVALLVVSLVIKIVSKQSEGEDGGPAAPYLCPRCGWEMAYNADYCATCGLRLTQGGGLEPGPKTLLGMPDDADPPDPETAPSADAP